jgi:hypothetical protein
MATTNELKAILAEVEAQLPDTVGPNGRFAVVDSLAKLTKVLDALVERTDLAPAETDTPNPTRDVE